MKKSLMFVAAFPFLFVLMANQAVVAAAACSDHTELQKKIIQCVRDDGLASLATHASSFVRDFEKHITQQADIMTDHCKFQLCSDYGIQFKRQQVPKDTLSVMSGKMAKLSPRRFMMIDQCGIVYEWALEPQTGAWIIIDRLKSNHEYMHGIGVINENTIALIDNNCNVSILNRQHNKWVVVKEIKTRINFDLKRINYMVVFSDKTMFISTTKYEYGNHMIENALYKIKNDDTCEKILYKGGRDIHNVFILNDETLFLSCINRTTHIFNYHKNNLGGLPVQAMQDDLVKSMSKIDDNTIVCTTYDYACFILTRTPGTNTWKKIKELSDCTYGNYIITAQALTKNVIVVSYKNGRLKIWSREEGSNDWQCTMNIADLGYYYATQILVLDDSMMLTYSDSSREITFWKIPSKQEIALVAVLREMSVNQQQKLYDELVGCVA